jgi:hypothetical protein
VRVTDRDKATEASRDGEAERTRPETGMIGSRLVTAGPVPAIPIICTLGPPDRDGRGEPGDLGSAAGSVATAGNRGRDGQLYFPKSHGMRHSSPIREFMRRGERLLLSEVYIGPERIRIGSARCQEGLHADRQEPARPAGTGRKQFSIRMRFR